MTRLCFVFYLLIIFLFVSSCGKTAKIPLDQFGDAAVHISGLGDVTTFVTKARYSYAASSQGIYVIDHRDFEKIELMAHFNGKVDDLIFADNDLLYAIAAGGHLSIIQISNNTGLKVVYQSAEVIPGPFVKMSIKGSILAIASGSDGLYFYDVSDKMAPKIGAVFRQDNIKGYNSVTLVDQYALLSAVDQAGQISLKVIDYLNSEGPTLVNSVDSNLSQKNNIATPGQYQLQSGFYNNLLWTTATSGLQGLDPLGDGTAKSLLAFETTPINFSLSDYLKMGFNGDIEGYATASGKQVHFILTTKGTARTGMMVDKQIIVADGKEGMIIADAQKIIAKIQTMLGSGTPSLP